MKKRWLIPVFATFMLLSTPNIDVEAATKQQLTQTAQQYLGAPYVYGGTTTRGFDCSGYTQKVFSDLGIKLNRTSRDQFAQGTAVSKSNLQAGDLVFFNTSGRGVSHVGIYIGNNKFIHSSTSKGVIISSLSERYWAPRYIGAKRVANFEVAQPQVKQAAIDFTVYSSRGEVAIRLAEALGLDTSDTNAPFIDVKPTDRVAGAATALQKIGVFEGNQQGKFNPNSPLTRAQMAKILTVAFDLKQNPYNQMNFNDVPTNHWAHEYVAVLASNNITVGRAKGVYGPNDYVTKTQLQTFIERIENM